MGTESDAEIARQIGCTQAAVRYKRGKVGIPAIFGLLWRDKELALLGTLRDEKLARRLDRTIKAVQAKRKSHGIPCFKPGKNFGDRRTTKFSARDRTA